MASVRLFPLIFLPFQLYLLFLLPFTGALQLKVPSAPIHANETFTLEWIRDQPDTDPSIFGIRPVLQNAPSPPPVFVTLVLSVGDSVNGVANFSNEFVIPVAGLYTFRALGNFGMDTLLDETEVVTVTVVTPTPSSSSVTPPISSNSPDETDEPAPLPSPQGTIQRFILPTGAIVAIIFGISIVVVLFFIFVWLYCYRRLDDSKWEQELIKKMADEEDPAAEEDLKKPAPPPTITVTPSHVSLMMHNSVIAPLVNRPPRLVSPHRIYKSGPLSPLSILSTIASRTETSSLSSFRSNKSSKSSKSTKSSKSSKEPNNLLPPVVEVHRRPLPAIPVPSVTRDSFLSVPTQAHPPVEKAVDETILKRMTKLEETLEVVVNLHQKTDEEIRMMREECTRYKEQQQQRQTISSTDFLEPMRPFTPLDAAAGFKRSSSISL